MLARYSPVRPFDRSSSFMASDTSMAIDAPRSDFAAIAGMIGVETRPDTPIATTCPG